MSDVQTTNEDGAWVPAIPLPFYLPRLTGLRFGCGDYDCDRRFWTMRGYRGHYALRHVLKLGDT
jgi:hypothetical protein